MSASGTSPGQKSARRVLIVRVGAMGDVLHALPGVAALRKARPDWQIDWAVDERWLPLLEGVGGKPGKPGKARGEPDEICSERDTVVDTAWSLPVAAWKQFPRSLQLPRSMRGLLRLRKPGYHFVVDLQGTLRSASVGWLAAGAGRLAGYATPRERPARWLYHDRFGRQGAHVVEQNATLLGNACGVPLTPSIPPLPHDAASEAWVQGALGELGELRELRESNELGKLEALGHSDTPRIRLALLAPGAGWGAKQWPASHFGALARALDAEGWTVLVNRPFGGEPAATGALAAAGPAAQAVTCTVGELLALLRQTSLVVGGDSGPVHLAAILGTPLVALFGPTDPARNGPWGVGPMRVLRHPASVTSYRHVAQPDPGMLQITVDDVLAAVHTL